jgi:hypothetical protein
MPTGTRSPVVHHARREWNRTRPRIMVIACSDGRLQEEIDDFLLNHLHIAHYDRLYLPGGPGALAYSGGETSRTAQQRRECLFLIRAHAIRRVVLLFPEVACCADYQRKLPGYTAEQIRQQPGIPGRDSQLAASAGRAGSRRPSQRRPAAVPGAGMRRPLARRRASGSPAWPVTSRNSRTAVSPPAGRRSSRCTSGLGAAEVDGVDARAAEEAVVEGHAARRHPLRQETW